LWQTDQRGRKVSLIIWKDGILFKWLGSFSWYIRNFWPELPRLLDCALPVASRTEVPACHRTRINKDGHALFVLVGIGFTPPPHEPSTGTSLRNQRSNLKKVLTLNYGPSLNGHQEEYKISDHNPASLFSLNFKKPALHHTLITLPWWTYIFVQFNFVFILIPESVHCALTQCTCISH